MAQKKNLRPIPEPPAYLTARAQALWREILQAEQDCTTTGRITMLETALTCLDRADQARVEIDKAGLTTVSERSKVVHLHPLVRMEAECRAQFLRIWASLGLSRKDYRGWGG